VATVERGKQGIATTLLYQLLGADQVGQRDRVEAGLGLQKRERSPADEPTGGRQRRSRR